MKDENLATLFLKHAYAKDYTITKKSVKQALDAATKGFLHRTPEINGRKDIIRYYYNIEGEKILPNERNEELMDFWDAYFPFHTKKNDLSSPLIRRIYEIMTLNSKLRLQRDIYFKNKM